MIDERFKRPSDYPPSPKQYEEAIKEFREIPIKRKEFGLIEKSERWN